MAFGIELEPPQPTGSTPIDAGLLDLLRDHDAWVWKTPGTAFWPAVKMALVSLDADDDHARLFVGIDGPAAATARAFAATAVDMVRPLVERITTDSDDGDFQLEVDMTAAQIQRMVTLAPMAMDAFRSYTKRGGKVAPVPVIAPAGGSTP